MQGPASNLSAARLVLCRDLTTT